MAALDTARLRAPDHLAPALTGLAAAAVALGIGAGAGVQPKATLGLAVAAVFALVVFQDLAAGVALFTFSVFLVQIPGLSSQGTTSAKLIGGLLALSWALTLVTQRATGIPAPSLLREHPVISGTAIFLAFWGFASMLWATDSGAAMSIAFRVAQCVLLVFIVFTALREPAQFRRVVWAYVAGALLATVTALVFAPSTLAAGEGARLATSQLDPNLLAALLVPAVVFSLMLLPTVRPGLGRVGLVVSAALFLVAIFLTQSRGGLVALGAVVVLAPVIGGPLRSRAVLIVLGAAAIAAVVFAFLVPLSHLGRVTDFTANGGSGRVDLWSVARKIFADHPFNGIGAGNFPVVEPRYALGNFNLTRVDFVVEAPKAVHNAYLQEAAELGIVGVLAWLLVTLSPVRVLLATAGRFAREHRLDEELLARALALGLIALLCAYVFLSAIYEKQLWLLIGTALAFGNLRRQGIGADGSLYDQDVSNQLVEQLERRVSERMDALLAEQAKLSRRHAALAIQEQELKLRARELDERAEMLAAAPAAAKAGVPPAQFVDQLRTVERERDEARARAAKLEEVRAQELDRQRARLADLATRERDLDRLARELEEREAGISRRAAAVAAREGELIRRAASMASYERAVQDQAEPAAAPEATAAPAPPPVPAGAPGGYTLEQLEQLVAERGGAHPQERRDEWEAYILFLGEYASAEGRLPASFDSLIEEQFDELL